MTLSEIKEQVMFQTNNDAEDVGDFLPALTDYINEAYDRLIKVWAKAHVNSGSENWPPLREPDPEPEESEDEEIFDDEENSGVVYPVDVPRTPEWTHRYLADWATWLVYRNGNPNKQQRGYAFRESFLWMLSTIADEGGKDGLDEDGNQKQYKNFYNIPV